MATASKKKSHRIEKRRKLDELYVTGVEVRFDKDGAEVGPFEDEADDGTVTIWVQPCNPLQREQAIRSAQAARSRALLNARRDEDSPDHVNTEAYLEGLSSKEIIEELIDYSQSENQRSAVREVLAREEWEDIRSLQDSIREWEEAGRPDPEEDEQWAGLVERDKEYGKQVFEELKRIEEELRESYQLFSRGELMERARDKRLDLIGSQAFIDAYEVNMLFYSCRDDENHDLLFFDDIDDLKSAPEQVRSACSKALNQFISEVDEAKNSPRVDPGSEPSDLPEKEETSDSSIPEEVNA